MADRIVREKRTLERMVALYCRSHHQSAAGLCPGCQELIDYAHLRLDRCRFKLAKPTCANCPVHCYKPEMRRKVKEVMRYSGPRMLLHHPVLALLHLFDGLRPAPSLQKKRE